MDADDYTHDRERITGNRRILFYLCLNFEGLALALAIHLTWQFTAFAVVPLLVQVQLMTEEWMRKRGDL